MVDAPKHQLSPAERIFVRINVVQTVLAVAGVFTGAVALYAALNESAAVRRQAEASVWPIIQLTTSDYLSDDAAGFTVSMTNTGVGPGRVKAMRVRINGESARDWSEAVAMIAGGANVPFGKNFVMGRAIGAGESLDLLSTSDPSLVRAASDLTASGRALIDYCYCSIFDACWSYDADRRPVEAERVRNCPDYGDQQFEE